VLEYYIEPSFRDALLSYREEGTSRYYSPNRRTYKRRLGSHEDAAVEGMSRSRQDGVRPRANVNTDPHARIADMDIEGIDVNMILPTGVGSFCSVEDPSLEMAVYRAYNTYMRDYCAPYPERLTGVMMVSGRSIEQSVADMLGMADEPWVVGVFPSLPVGMPLDDPDLNPLWAAASDLHMTVCLHTFTYAPPYAPGAGDNWDNGWLVRSAAHPWCGQRNMAALLGSGALDRFPNLRIATLEAGHGWLPYWISRLEEQAKMFPSALPPDMKRISVYVDSGRYFQSIELHEGPNLTKHVIDSIGENVLMFASDYPHGETWFPEAVNSFLAWEGISTELKAKMMWDNVLQCYPRYALLHGEAHP
jgi:predicted TIM-barrel fold metal-dependent hydrolase